MAAISASMVKDLRDKTGAGMMDCKTALVEFSGDMEAAIDWLRAKGLSKAAVKADRVAAQGLVGVSSAAKTGAVVEVNCETDFVARNPDFQATVGEIAKLALKAGGDVEKLGAATYPKTKATVADHLKGMVGTIGENMSLRRTAAPEGQGRRGRHLYPQSGRARHGQDWRSRRSRSRPATRTS